jgi:transposase
MASCAAPETFGLERTTWSQQTLADVVSRDLGCSMSRSEVCRTLQAIGLAPHRYRKWVHSPDRAFRAKAAAICDLYCQPPANATVLCVDEKPGMQALERRFPTQTSLSGLAREEFEYIRHGTQVLLAALDVRSGEVIGEVCAKRTAANLVAFMERLAKRYPRGPIIVIWDNLNIHYDGKDRRWTRFNARHGHRFSFVYTPKHASWLNQIEIWFSILQRQLLRHGSFCSTAELGQRILHFIDDYRRRAKPFRWTFRGDFGHDRPRLSRCATTRRCQTTEQNPTTNKLSKSNFARAVLDTLASAAVAQC